MSLKKRYFLFICGLFFMSLGICLIIKSSLGTSPISSIPYILSLKYALTLGAFTFIVNMVFLLCQILILQRQFPYIQLLQIPMTILFSCFIDLTMFLLSSFNPDIYTFKIMTLLLGCLALALGVALQIIGNVVMLAGEGFMYSIVKKWRFGVGYTKTFFDISLVILAGALSQVYFNEIHGIREGTLISACIVGAFARFFIQHLSIIDNKGCLIFHLPFKNYNAKNNQTVIRTH
ncbi:MAG: DUF6198 family protein [Pelosinus sp.]|nr:DUF6198 family protein [Pelosinus sp.]